MNSRHSTCRHPSGHMNLNNCLPSRFHISPKAPSCPHPQVLQESMFLPSRTHPLYQLHLLPHIYREAYLPVPEQLHHTRPQGRRHRIHCCRFRHHPQWYSNMKSLQSQPSCRRCPEHILPSPAYSPSSHARMSSRTLQKYHNPHHISQGRP